MVGDTRQGWALLAAMTLIFVVLLALCVVGRAARQSDRSRRRASTRRLGALQPGGNMEGKEARFGIVNSALWATATTVGLQRLGQLDARFVHADSAAWCRCG